MMATQPTRATARASTSLDDITRGIIPRMKKIARMPKIQKALLSKKSSIFSVYSLISFSYLPPSTPVL